MAAKKTETPVQQPADTQAEQHVEQQQPAVGFEAEMAKIDKLLADETLAVLHAELSKVRNSMIRERIRNIQKEVATLRKMLPPKAKREKKA